MSNIQELRGFYKVTNKGLQIIRVEDLVVGDRFVTDDTGSKAYQVIKPPYLAKNENGVLTWTVEARDD